MAKRSKRKNRSPEVTRAPQIQARARSTVVPSKLFLLQALAIVAAGLWVFWPALFGGFLWDDHLYITHNPLLHDPARLWKAWFDPGSFIEYYPIEQSVSWTQWQLFGTGDDNPLGYHLTNTFLHIANALLVWRLLSKFGLRLAWFGGLIFAIHPTAVESVAWISELKNTLSLTPFLLSMCALIDYEDRGERKDYYLALGLFLVAMLCKASMAPFPIVILLYVWWKRGRIGWSDLRDSLPFFAISLVLGALTILVGHWYQQRYMIPPDVAVIGGIFSRLALSGVNYSTYLAKCFWPVRLLPAYPKWTIDPHSLLQFLPWLILCVVIGLAWWKRTSWGRHVLLGLGFFLLNLAPFVGFIPTSYMKNTWVMDHFLYIPIIGIIALVVAGMEQLDGKLSRQVRPFAIGIVIVVMGLLAWDSHSYAAMFLDEETISKYTLQHNPAAVPAYQALGYVLLNKGHPEEAIEQFQQVVKLDPTYTLAHHDMGVALLKLNRTAEAVDQFQQSLKGDPHNAATHKQLGYALYETGQIPEAIEHYRQALDRDPNDAETHHNLAVALLQSNQVPSAIQEFEEAIKLNPNYFEAHRSLGNAFLQTNQTEEALVQYEQAVSINPNDADAHSNLGSIYGRQNRVSDAIEQYKEALQIDPNNAQTHDNLGYAYSTQNQNSQAIEQYQLALQANPSDATAQAQLARLRATAPAVSP
jgi:tetratricopeptide (TPR) repeat protein